MNKVHDFHPAYGDDYHKREAEGGFVYHGRCFQGS